MTPTDLDAKPRPADSGREDSALRPLALCSVPPKEHSKHLEFLREALAGTVEAPPVTVLNSLSEAEKHLGTSNLSLVLVYEPAVWTLSADMARGTSPSAALRSWTGTVKDILHLVRRHRRRITTVGTHMIARHPEALIRHLCLTRGSGQLSARPVSEHTPRDPIFHLLASEVLRQDPAALAIAGELEASALDLTDGAPRSEIDADAVSSRYQELLAGHEILIQQLQHTREELEQYYLKVREFEIRLEQEQSAIAEKDEEVRELSAREGHLVAELEAAQSALTRLRAMTSYRMMKPFRRLRGAFMRRRRANG